MSFINKITLFLALSVASSMLWTVQGFQMMSPTSSTSQRSSSMSPLYYLFEQKPGESDVQFIARITSKQSVEDAAHGLNKDDDTETPPKKKKGTYQRIEDWEKERNDSGVLSWEEKVQFDGQRLGNQVRQDSILRRHLSAW